MAEIIGWGSALVLLPAFGLQTYRQWKNRHEPANPSAFWFFVLVLIGTGGQVAYSWMVRNWVYLALNSALVVNNGVGLGIAIWRRQATGAGGARHLPQDGGHDARASAMSPATSSEFTDPGLRGHPTMNLDDHSPDSPGEGQQPATPPPVVVTTTDPVVASGGRGDEGQALRPDETVVAETSRVDRAVPGYASLASPFVEPKRGDPSKQHGGENKDKDKKAKGDAQGKGEDHPGGHDKDEARSKRPAWMGLAMSAVVALVCGVGGAWAFSYFDSSKNKDQSKGGQSKGGGGSTKPGGSSTGQGKAEGGQAQGDPDSESSKSMAKGDADLSKDQIQQLYSRFAVLQQRLDAMSTPRDTNSPDLAGLRVKMGELSGKVDEVANIPGRNRRIEERLDRLQDEVKGLRDQLSARGERGVAAPPAPVAGDPDRKVESMAAPSPPPMDAGSTDGAMASAIELFKKGQYTRADEDFGKLRASKPKDARVWYFSALAHGFATGKWDGETRLFVVQGADRERSGSPPAAQIDSVFAELSPGQGKDWLASYRSQLVKR